MNIIIIKMIIITTTTILIIIEIMIINFIYTALNYINMSKCSTRL